MISKEDRLKYLGFDDKIYSLLVVPIIGFLFPILFLGGFEDGWDAFKANWIESTLHTFVYWYLLRYVQVFLRKKYPKIEDTGKRITIQVIIFIICGFLIGTFFHILFQHIICQEMGWFVHDHAREKAVLLPTYFTVFAFLAGYEAKYFYNKLRQSIEEKEAAKQAQIRSELEGLRNQVNPHFLFNSMNTLMNLVMADQKVAISFLKKLSKVYRYVLESRDEQLIPLTKELDFIHSYVFLQEERFKGNLEVNIDIPKDYQCHKIIPLSMQILFENAIKHNVISRKKPLYIEVYIEDEKLVVRNNLQRKEQVMHSTKVGLENIKTRYNYFTDREVVVEEDELYFIVKIPVIRVQKRVASYELRENEFIN